MRIPYQDNYSVAPSSNEAPYQRSSANEVAFGSQVGQAMQGLGNQIDRSLDVAQKIKTEMSTLAVEDKYNNEVSDLFRDLDKGYTTQMGKNAVDGYEGALDQLSKAKTKILEGISDPQEQSMMTRMLDRRFQQSRDYYDRHREQQFRIYKDDTFTASRAMTVQNAVDFAGDAKIFDQYRRTNEYLIEDYGLQNGWSGEKIEMEKRKDRDALVSSSVQSLIQQSPQQAMAFLSQHQDKISPEIAGKARKMLDPYYAQMAVDDFMAGAESGKINPDMMTEIITPKTAPPPQIKAILDDASRRHGVPANLVYAVAYAESKFDPKAGSHAGAVGLMQLMPKTAKGLGIDPSERTDPVKSADGGTHYLGKMLTKYKNNVALALGAYNAGPGNMDTAIKKAGAGASAMEVLQHLPKKEETIPYVQGILKMAGGGEGKQQPVEQTIAKPVAQPETVEQVEAWRSAMLSRTGGIYQKEQAEALNSAAAQKIRVIKARNDASDSLVIRAVASQLEEKGAINLTELRTNPEIAQALEYATPSFILSLSEKAQTAQSKRADEVMKQEEKSAEEASNHVYMSRYGQMMADPNFAKDYNPARDPELTPSQMEKLWKLREDVTTRGDKQIASDPLHANLKQGADIFDDLYKTSYGGSLDKDYKLSKDFLFLQGVTIEAINQAQLMNGGKVLPADEQRRIAERVFVKNVSGGRLVSEIYKDVKKSFPTATEQQLQAGTANALRIQNEGVALKNALK